MKTKVATLPGTPPATAPVWASLAATFFGIGRLKPGPGTWASLAAVLIWFALARWIPVPAQPSILAIISLVAVLVGIPAATRVARTSDNKDPQFVVIDEVAGQWVALLFTPVSWKTLLAGFILFRGFDILKPPPVRNIESLPEGTGIVLDDIGAGIYALAVMQLLLHSGILLP